MRQIKFRGKRVDNAEWVFGDLIQFEGSTIAFRKTVTMFDEPKMIYVEHEVIPETVGQFTGLLDKECNEIYEGDLVWTLLSDGEKPPFPNLVEWFRDGWYLMLPSGSIARLLDVRAIDHKVIGNIHDNPELL